MIDRAGIDRVASPLVHRHRLAGQDRLLNGGTAREHRTIGRDPFAGADEQDITNRECIRGDLHRPTIPEHGRRPRAKLQQLLDGPLRPFEGERLQAFPEEGDKDDLGRHEVFAQQARRDASDRQGDIGPDPPLQQGRDCQIDHPTAADHRRQQRERHAERPPQFLHPQQGQQEVGT